MVLLGIVTCTAGVLAGVMLLALAVMIFYFLTMVIGYVTDSAGLEFLNPVYLHSLWNVNWFGAIFIAIIFNATVFPCAIGYWFYKICAIGRK